MTQEFKKERGEFTTLKNKVRKSGCFSDFENYLAIENLQEEIKSVGLQVMEMQCYLNGLLRHVARRAHTIIQEHRGKYIILPSVQKGLGDVLVSLEDCFVDEACAEGITLILRFVENPIPFSKIKGSTDKGKHLSIDMIYTFSYMEIGQLIDFLDGEGYVNYQCQP